MDRGLFRVSFPFGMGLLVLAIFTACSKGLSTSSTGSAVLNPIVPGNLGFDVSWSANHEVDVNKAGGGYRVYYAAHSGVSTSTDAMIDVPYVSGATSPTTAHISGVSAATYWIRVVAYSAFNPNSISGGNHSGDSGEVSVVVP